MKVESNNIYNIFIIAALFLNKLSNYNIEIPENISSGIDRRFTYKYKNIQF